MSCLVKTIQLAGDRKKTIFRWRCLVLHTHFVDTNTHAGVAFIEFISLCAKVVQKKKKITNDIVLVNSACKKKIILKLVSRCKQYFSLCVSLSLSISTCHETRP